MFDKRDAEAAFVRENRIARGEVDPEVAVREGGELEEAIEAWSDDQAWERMQVNGKGKASVLGSKLRSTGEVEQRARGWGWK